MNRTIALAYAITGLAVAAALVAIIGSTTGLFASGVAPVAPSSHVAARIDQAHLATSALTPQASDGIAPTPASLPGASGEVDPSGAEIVYVDASVEAQDEHHDHRKKHDPRDRKRGDRKHHDEDDDDD